MENLTQLLADNNLSEVEVITSIENYDHLPEAWKQMATASTLPAKKEVLSTYWQPFAEKMPKTIALLDNSLQDVLLVKDAGEFKLLYIFDIDDFISIYVGHLPVVAGPYLEEMPVDISAFYKQIHNGWFESISGGLGFLPSNQISALSADEWDISDELVPADIDLSKVIYVLHNGGSGYLCINLTTPTEPEYLIFWTDRKLKRGIPFWPFLDSWIEIGLTN